MREFGETTAPGSLGAAQSGPFSVRGRADRLEFFKANVLAGLMTLPLYFAEKMADSPDEVYFLALAAVGLVLLVPALWISLAAGIRRLHDNGWSGWWVIIWFIPILGLVFGLLLLFKPGQDDDNIYGPAT